MNHIYTVHRIEPHGHKVIVTQLVDYDAARMVAQDLANETGINHEVTYSDGKSNGVSLFMRQPHWIEMDEEC